jgi:3-oxoacyl-[acyl-carrier-protein] synthase II
MDRIVVTGLGIVSSLGMGQKPFWNKLLRGENGITDISSFDTGKFRVHRGGEIHDFNAQHYLKKQNPESVGRASQLAIAATQLAIEDSGIDLKSTALDDIGVCIGTTSGEATLIEQFDDHRFEQTINQANSGFISQYPCHVIATHVAREFGFGGLNSVIPAACAAGNYAIAASMDALRGKRASIMLAGGADAFSRITYSGFARLGAISPDLCRPFDFNRKGMIPAEGAAMLVLEPLTQAKARNATIYAEVAGYGLSCDAYHMTAPASTGSEAAKAMLQALKSSQLNPDDVSYICAHGTGTKVSDKTETTAIKRVFGEQAYKTPVSSIKSMLGHTMGAASAIETVACSLAIYHDWIPPTANWQTSDPDCDLDYVTSGARQQKVEVAMNNAYAFGGYNASLILKKIRK